MTAQQVNSDIKKFLQKILSPKTGTGRAVRTLIQVTIAILGFTFGLLTIPGLGEYLVANNIVAMSTLAVLTGVVSYLYNAVEAFWKWIRG